MRSYKSSLTDFLNTFRTSNGNLSYNNGFRRLKIIITTIIKIMHPQTLDFSPQHHWKTITVLRQSPPRLPCFPKAQNLPSSLFSPDQKQWANWLESSRPAVLLVFPGNVVNHESIRISAVNTSLEWPEMPGTGRGDSNTTPTALSVRAWHRPWPHCFTRLTSQPSSSISGSAVRWWQANGKNLYQFLCKCF